MIVQSRPIGTGYGIQTKSWKAVLHNPLGFWRLHYDRRLSPSQVAVIKLDSPPSGLQIVSLLYYLELGAKTGIVTLFLV